MGSGQVTAPHGPRWREFPLLDRIRGRFSRRGPGDVMGMGDDASAHRPDAGRLELVTCDALVEGVHWQAGWCGPRELGRKAAAVNVSDVAAMGGTPERAWLVLALPRSASERLALELTAGLVQELARHGARLCGGDTVATPGPMFVSLTLQGSVLPEEMLTRAGARPGDAVFVTGDLGAAAAGLCLLQRPGVRTPGRRALVRHLLAPEPRLAAGRILARSRRVHAALDLSDGLAGDLRRLASASGVGVRLCAEAIPISPAVRRAARDLHVDALALALTGGEDYELLFTAPAGDAPGLARRMRRTLGLACTQVGEIVPARQGLHLTAGGRVRPLPAGWEHNPRARNHS